MNIKEGKKPISAKPGVQIVSEDPFGNPLTIGSELEKELAKQGLVGRWVNATELYKFQGYHPKGWRVYKTQNNAILSNKEFRFGNDPEGVVRRGDCILAVKDQVERDKHRAFLDARADRQIAGAIYRKKELQEFAAKRGVKVAVTEGYDEDDNGYRDTEK